MIRDLVKELRIFERNKVPEEIKILGIAIYFQTSSFRRTARILSELILMRVYTTRNWLVTRSFVKEVLKYCNNKPKFVVDKAPWLVEALKSLDLEFEHEGFWEKRLG